MPVSMPVARPARRADPAVRSANGSAGGSAGGSAAADLTALLDWREERTIAQRCAHVLALVRALNVPLDAAGRGALEGVLSLVAADPAPRVRLVLAEAIGTVADAPVAVIAQLATDRPDIAGLVLARSPVVTQADLVDLVPRLDPRVLPVLAARATDPDVAVLIIEMGEAEAVAELLRNPVIALGPAMLDAAAEAHGHVPAVRDLLLARDDLPIGARYALVEGLCRVLAATDLVVNVLGVNRARSVLDDAEGEALVNAAAGRDAGEIAALVDALVEAGRIDATLILRALCHGRRELFAALLTRQAGLGAARVRSILRSRRQNSLKALFERCDVTPEVAAMLAQCAAIVLAAPAPSGPAALTTAVLERVRPVCSATGALLVAVRRWQVEAMRRGGQGLVTRAAA